MKFFNGKKTRTENTVIIPALTRDLQRIVQLREFVSKYDCPNCTHKALKIVKIHESKEGWEVQLLCNDCKSTGTLNTTGLEVDLSGIPERQPETKEAPSR